MSIKNCVNIVVVGYGLPDIETKCLSSIRLNTQYPYLLTFFDNYVQDIPLTEIWNFLIGKSPCDKICLLNNDTEVHSGWLTFMVETLLKAPKACVVGPSTNQCHSPQKTINTFEKAKECAGKVVEMQDPISGFCLLFNKSLWKELGGFDQKFKFYGQESLFISKAQKLGYKVYWRQDAFVYHHGSLSIKSSGKNEYNERMQARKLYKQEVGKISCT